MAHVAAVRRATVSLLALITVAGCHRKAPSPEPVAAVSAEPSTRPAPVSEIHESNYELSMKPLGAIVAGQPGVVEITVVPRGGYHVNQQYPYKFKPAPSAGVSYGSMAFTADAAKLEPKQATMSVTFTPDGKGDRTVAGLFAFSLCSADQCLIEKRDLALHVTVD